MLDYFMYGLCQLPWWGDILVVLAFTQVTILSVTIFLHRNQAHRALDLHPIVSHFFRFWLWLTTGMLTKEWTAVHRKHHAKCETAEDPHSPQVLGLPLVLWQGAELYRKEAANKETLIRFGEGTPDDWLERNLYVKSKLGISLTLMANLVLFGVPGLAMWAIQMIWIPFFAAGVVNGVGHYWGYRNFECPDEARNIVPFGFIIGGEELHNNHHTYPTSAKFSVKWWEFDLGWLYIRLFEILGLAKVKRVPPTPNLMPGKTQIDMETLKALIINRFQIMSDYSKKVLIPVLKQENNANKRIEELLVRETSLLDQSAKRRLARFLAENKTIQEAYQFKERLQNLWAQSSLKESDLLEALQKWCQEAEATGIAGLKEFSKYLRSLTLKAV